MDTLPGVQQRGIILVRIEQLSSRLKHALAKPKAWLPKALLLPKSLLKGQIWCRENTSTWESGTEQFLAHSCQCNCNLSYWILSFICLWALIWFIMVSRNLNHTVLAWNNDVTGKVDLVLCGNEGKGLILEAENAVLLHCCLVWVSWALPVTSQCIRIASFLDHCWKTKHCCVRL